MGSLEAAQQEAVPLPGNAFDDAGTDVLGPTVKILKALNLLAKEEQNGFAQAFTGPPDSASVLEAGVTAASKWWSVAGAAAIVSIWGSVVGFWEKQPEGNQRLILLSAAIASAALILAIGYLLASDVRGRAAATVAILNSRAAVATEIIRAARPGEPSSEASDTQVVAVKVQPVTYHAVKSGDEKDWKLLALLTTNSGTTEKLLIAKDQRFLWVKSSDIELA